jgi:imidazolonepropionase-like amidohydrolase
MEKNMKRLSASLSVAIAIWSGAASADTIAITNVTVIPIRTTPLLRKRTVVIDDGKIIGIAPDQRIPEGAHRVDGTGKFLMPALSDMHVHLFLYFPHERPTLPLQMTAPLEVTAQQNCAARNELYLYLKYGVATVRDLSGTPTTLAWADKVSRGEVDGPKIHVATPILDGNPPANPTGTAVSFTSPSQVPQAMAVLAATRVGNSRYEFVKIYERMQSDVYERVLSEARKYDLPIVGHVPFPVPIEKVIADGQRSIEHLRGYEVDPHHIPTDSLSPDRWTTWNNVSDERITMLARLTAGKELWNVPTLVINQDGMGQVAIKELDTSDHLRKYVSAPLLGVLQAPIFPPAIAPAIFSAQLSTLGKQRKMIHALIDNDDRIMTGTDSPGLGVVPGASLHREMELLVDYGLSPYQALRASTLEPQLFMKNESSGYVGVGAHGDYLLLDANPLTDIRNSRQIDGVVVDGKWWSDSSLEKKLLETRSCAQ